MTHEYPADLPIWTDPDRMGGVPCFLHTRIPVESLFVNLEDGVGLDEYLDAFPGVKRAAAIAVLAFARRELFVPAA